jgi:hypothetical protein
MEFAIHPDAKPCHLVANTMQLHHETDRTGSRRRETRGFLDRSHAFSRGINVSRITAISLGVALAFAFGTSARAAELLQVPSSVAVPFDWTGAYIGGHVGHTAGWSDWSAIQVAGIGSPAEPISPMGSTCLKAPAASLVGFRAVTTSRFPLESCSALRPMPRFPI